MKNLTIALLLLSSSALADAELGQPAPAFSLKDIHGKTVTLKPYDGKVVVLEWLNYDCPFVKKHYGAKNMQAMQKRFTEAGVIWFSVISSAPGKQGNYPPAELEKMSKERGAHPTAILLDPTGVTGKAYGAKTTPHLFIINRQGQIAYNGAIDDKPSTDPADIKGAQNYVVAALESILKDQPAAPALTKPYGCSVKY